MAGVKPEDHTLEETIAALEEAVEGSRELDCMIACALGSGGGEYDQIMMRELVSEGYSWNSVAELWADRIPAYTTSLDAAVAGEDIRCVLHSSKRGRWAAVHKTPEGGEILMWAANEVLARRLAALKGLTAGRSDTLVTGAAVAGIAGDEPAKALSAPERRSADEENKEWSILF